MRLPDAPDLCQRQNRLRSTQNRRTNNIPGISYHMHNLAAQHRNFRQFFSLWWRLWQPIFIVSPVRNVVEQSMSLFFQRNAGYITRKTTGRRLAPLGQGRSFTPEEEKLHTQFSTEQLIDIYFHFLTEIITEIDDWFDANIKRNTRIDVFASPFPTETGIKIYTHHRLRLLVMQAELTDTVKEHTISQFTHCPTFRLARHNVGDDNYYGTAYRQFKKAIRFTPKHMDLVCASRYFRHFYSPDFIEQCRARYL